MAQRTTTSAGSGTCPIPTGLAIGDQCGFAAWSDTASATLTDPSANGDSNTWVLVAGGSESGGAASTLYVWRCDSITSVPANFVAAGATIAGTIAWAEVADSGYAFTSASGSTLASSVAAGAASLTSNAVNAGAKSRTFIIWSADDDSTVSSAPSGMTQEALPTVSGGDLVAYSIADANNAAYTNSLTWSTNGTERMAVGLAWNYTASSSVALTGTAASGMTEQRVRDGGYTIILTASGDTFVAAGATFDAQRQAIINGLDSAQAEAAGWDAVVKAGIPVTAVVRTSNTVVTITLPAFASYQITATETITATLPASALTGGVAIVAAPTFTVTRGAGDLVQPVGVTNASGVPGTSSGSFTTDRTGITRFVATVAGSEIPIPVVITAR